MLVCSRRPPAPRTSISRPCPIASTVQLTIYNSEDITLVRETRQVTFKKGANPLQFSLGQYADRPVVSVELKFLTQADKLDVLDTTFPHDKPQMLYWNVQSEIDGEATIQITYFTSGITWTRRLPCIADADEKNDAASRASSACTTTAAKNTRTPRSAWWSARSTSSRKSPSSRTFRSSEVAKHADAGPAARSRCDAAARHAARRRRRQRGQATPQPPKEIIKEGLSEYFIYTIEGTETIPNGWSKRMRSLEAAAVPFKIQYRYRPQEYGDQLVRMYLLTNDKESKLGTTPLPDGMVRVFRDNGRDGLSYLTQQSIKYIPIGDKIELNLGRDPEVIFELIKLRAVPQRHLAADPRHQRIPQDRRRCGDEDRERLASPAGTTTRSTPSGSATTPASRSTSKSAARFPGTSSSAASWSRSCTTIRPWNSPPRSPPASGPTCLFELVRKQGTSAKQNNVTLEEAEIKP